MSANFTVWIGALFTIAAFSYLFKENKFYKAAEHIYVGVAAGYSIVMGYTNIVSKVYKPVLEKGQVVLLLPFVIGLLLFAPYAGDRYRWMRRIPLAFITGVGAGLSIRAAVENQLVKQVAATVLALNKIDNIIIVLGVSCVIAYFFFTFTQSRVLKTTAEAGKWVMMITFGAAFGNAFMGRISLLIGRVQFIFGEWIHIIKM